MSQGSTEVSRLQVWYGVVKGDSGECPKLKVNHGVLEAICVRKNNKVRRGIERGLGVGASIGGSSDCLVLGSAIWEGV